MTDIFRRTVRRFLHKERPETRDEAVALLDNWFGRYGLDPKMLAEEVDQHFAGTAH